MLELIINTTSDTPKFYQNITNGAGKWIGELYQDYLFDRESGEYIGLNQGYAFNFDDGIELNNNIMILEEGQSQIYWSGNAIISASGAYSKYQGGSVILDVIQYNPVYIATVTLVDPPPQLKEDGSGNVEDQDSLKLRVTSDGGYYSTIISDGVQVGQVFQNIITNPDNSSDVIGYNKCNSYLYPPDNFTSDVLGLSLNEQLLALGIRYFTLQGDDSGTLTLIDEHVVHATGSLLNYTGGRVTEQIISTDPYVAEVTISPPGNMGSEGEDVEAGPSSFRFSAEDGFFEPMYIGDNNTLLGDPLRPSLRFRDSVYDDTNTRIGTNQGFAFSFPKTYLPEWALPYIAIRNVYLEGGTLDILNEVVVGATGIYKKYVGWGYDETVVSYNPVFLADIKLVEPSTSGVAENSVPTPNSPPSTPDKVTDGANVEKTTPSPIPGPTTGPSSGTGGAMYSCQMSALAYIVAILLS